MSTTTAAEATRINGVEFREELERIESQDPGIEFDADAFDALEAGLPVSHAAQVFAVPHHERAPIGEPYEPPVEQSASAETHIPFMAAALVLVACLTAGAATAAFVFHDRVTQITALWSATR